MNGKFFKENGFLNNDGEKLVHLFKYELNDILSSTTVAEMSEAELRILGTNLSKMVGDAVSNTMLKRNSK